MEGTHPGCRPETTVQFGIGRHLGISRERTQRSEKTRVSAGFGPTIGRIRAKGVGAAPAAGGRGQPAVSDNQLCTSAVLLLQARRQGAAAWRRHCRSGPRPSRHGPGRPHSGRIGRNILAQQPVPSVGLPLGGGPAV
jgi:hypothetical protein